MLLINGENISGRRYDMSMKSQSQRKMLWATNPKVAEKLEKETPKGKKLPKKVKKEKGKKKK